MTFRVGIEKYDPMMEGLWLVIYRPGDYNQVVESIGSTITYKSVAQNEHNETHVFLPDDIARPLLDALAIHYGGASDIRTLRKDYTDERLRVDKLIAHLVNRDR